ncbi:hypothetical protein Tco_0132236 [Tanacetum coccineum]
MQWEINPEDSERTLLCLVVLDALALRRAMSNSGILSTSMNTSYSLTGKIKSISNVVVDQMHQPEELLLLSSVGLLSGKNPVLTSFVFLEHKSFEECNIRRMWTILNYFRKISLIRLTTEVTKKPTKKSKRVKRAAKKSTNAPTTSVVIRDTPGVSVSNKKAPAKTDRGKGIELLSDATLLKDAQLKKALKKSKQETYKLQASGSSEGADFESEVPDKSKAKSSDTSEGTSVKLGVPDVSKAESSWGDSEDDNESDHYNDKGSKNDDDDSNDAQDSERTDSDEEENPNINVNVDEEEETQEEEDVPIPDYSVPTDEETDDENKEFDDEEYAGLYKDVNVRSKVIEHEEVGKGNVEMTDATRESGSKQSSSVSSDFASKFLILDNVPPVIDEVASMMSVKIGFATQTDLQSYTVEFEKNAQEEKDRYIDLVEKSIKDIIKDEVKSQLPQILPKEVSDFTTPTRFRKSKAYQVSDNQELYDALVKSYKIDKDLFEYYGNTYSLKRDCDYKDKDEDLSLDQTESQSKSSGKSVQAEEPEFEVADSDMPQNQEGNLGNDDEEPMREVASKRDCPVKVAYNKHAKWGISHWREQRKTFYGYARGLESSYDVYSTKHILAVTRVEVMRKQGYGYLREIEVQRVDNELYTFKEGNFPRLRINDIEDMVILVVQNRLTNLLDDDVSDMVIKKRVKDLQLGVKSYQKKINVTKPYTTRPDIRKRDPYLITYDP